MPEPFRVSVPDEALDELRARLAHARWPNEIAGAGWTYGTDLAYLRDLAGYWGDGFDWRAREAVLNSFDQFTTTVDGQRIHFVHQRSAVPDALPLLLVHGWPGSVVEFLDAIPLLTSPPDPADAFHVVAPSLPGYAFSGPTSEPGWHPRRMAAAFSRVMASLGYERYGVQGGDWGSIVVANVADLEPGHVAGLHVNFLSAPRPAGARTASLPAEEQTRIEEMRAWQQNEAGYSAIQGTKPQTVGYALEDSPVGLAGWIVEKFRAWSDCGGDVERSFTRDQLLTNVSVYWFTATATSSARLYFEMRRAGAAAVPQAPISVPTGVANYPGEVTKVPRSWAERRYNITHWVDMPRGGHFAAMEVPELFVDDVRAFFRTVR
ncbi:MAG TPA: epoxide hydrolase [Acidimicrobiales bacterium]|nr:epoxide hydrolase [Acidimicrobiales bacterium]